MLDMLTIATHATMQIPADYRPGAAALECRFAGFGPTAFMVEITSLTVDIFGRPCQVKGN